jgi:hypothetical protein
MALSHKGVGGHYYIGLALKAVGVLTIVLSLTASGFRSAMSPMPLVPFLVVAGVHWVSWRLYVHNI